MTSNGRLAALVLAGLAAAGGVLVQVSSPDGGGFPLFLFAVLIVIGTVFEARYRGRKGAIGAQWQITREREIDHETGTIIEVWFDPVSGERRYVPAGHTPEQAGPK